jgi:hypothetical protein
MSDLAGIKDRLTLVTAGAYFDETRREYDANGNLIFEGLALVHKTSISGDEWYIWKYTYDSNNNRIREEGPLDGAWDNRHALAWGGESVDVGKPDINADLVSINLLGQVLHQIKITNLYLSILTDTEVTDEEI